MMQQKKLQKISAVLLVLLLVFSLTACGKKEESTSTTEEYVSVAEASDLVLPYSREDGINPYKATSLMNEGIMDLLYQGLYTIDKNYKPTATLATEASFSGKTLTVKLNTDSSFSDGTYLNSSDVVYSFNLAKESTYYATGLSQFSSVQATTANTVTFTLSRVNVYALSNLTFPIVKSGTATDSSSIPVGSGSYTYAQAESGGLLTLQKGQEGKTEQIYLLNVTDSDSLLNNLAIGNVDLVYDDICDGTLTRVDNAKEAQVDMNHLLFIGVNEKTAGLSEAETRQNISAVLNRTDLISTGVDGYGTPSTLPFNPAWYGLDGVETQTAKQDAAKAAVAQTFTGTTLTILTDADNAFKVKTANAVAQQLANAGINTKVEALTYQEYAKQVVSGGYDLYIGEIKLTQDMDLSSLLSGDLLDNFYYLWSGDLKVSDFVTAFTEDMPFIPIGFRNGVVCYTQDMTTEVETLPGSPFANLQKVAKRSK